MYGTGNRTLAKNAVRAALAAAILPLVMVSASAATLPINTTPLTPTTGSTTLTDGSVVNFTQNNVTQGGVGTLTGTSTQGGASTPFTCSYDAARRQLTGSALCNQLLAGAATGGFTLADLERSIVAARLDVASQIQASANIQVLTDVVQRRIGLNVATAAQAQLDVAGASASTDTAFGSPQFQSWAFAGGSFLNDDRLGLEKKGHGIVATAGVDHTAGNTLFGAYVAYLNSDLDLLSLDGKVSSEGWSLGGYATYIFDRVFSMSVAGSYGESTVDLRRALATATPVTGSHGHQEWSVSATGNAFWRVASNLGLTLFAAAEYDHWADDAYTDSAGIQFANAGDGSTYGKVGSVLTLSPGALIEPYVTATYSRLLSDPQFVTNRDSLIVGGGIALVSRGISGGLEVNTLLLQDGQSNTTIGLNIRFPI